MRHVLLVLGLIACAPAGQAEPDGARGALLYENHCLACHESVVHVRSNRRVETRGGLRAQIRRWSGAQGLGWGEAEIADVLDFLDRRYCRLDAEPGP